MLQNLPKKRNIIIFSGIDRAHQISTGPTRVFSVVLGFVSSVALSISIPGAWASGIEAFRGFEAASLQEHQQLEILVK
ncbi:hypothetical protein ACP70R_032413 [Stipagrostis hirtigluma subsp. patula]